MSCLKLPEERNQWETVTINTGPPDVESGGAEVRSIKHTFCHEALGEDLFASYLGAFALFLDYPRTVIFSRPLRARPVNSFAVRLKQSC